MGSDDRDEGGVDTGFEMDSPCSAEPEPEQAPGAGPVTDRHERAVRNNIGSQSCHGGVSGDNTELAEKTESTGEPVPDTATKPNTAAETASEAPTEVPIRRRILTDGGNSEDAGQLAVSGEERTRSTDSVTGDEHASDEAAVRPRRPTRRRRRYRQVTMALVALGVVTMAAGFALADSSDVLFALAATGLFGAVVTYFLTPGRFVDAAVTEHVFTANATNVVSMLDRIGDRGEPQYVPLQSDEPSGRVELFVPYRSIAAHPLADGSQSLVADGDTEGVILEPTGSGLLRDFERDMTGDLDSSPESLAVQLADGLTNGFEIARSIDVDVDTDARRGRVSITEPALDDLTRFDHPIPSFLAVGFATALNRPITTEVERVDDGEHTFWDVTCRWDDEPTDPDS